MEEQLMETIEYFGGELEVEVTSPAQHHHFYANEDAEILDKKERNFTVTAKLLHIVKQGCPDLERLVSFLTMRVTKINVDDWKKLNIGLAQTKNTIKYKRIIGAKTLYDLYMYIDAAYAVQNNMRGHTGGAISMRYEIIHGKSSKQKINMKSST